MSIPVRGFEEGYESSGTAENRVEGETLEETVERVRSSLGKLGSETVAAYVFCVRSVESQ